MDYFLGVDIGTTSAKAIAFNEKGELICKHSLGYEMQHPQQTHSELNPNDILDAVVSCINRLSTRFTRRNPGSSVLAP